MFLMFEFDIDGVTLVDVTPLFNTAFGVIEINLLGISAWIFSLSLPKIFSILFMEMYHITLPTQTVFSSTARRPKSVKNSQIGQGSLCPGEKFSAGTGGMKGLGNLIYKCIL